MLLLIGCLSIDYSCISGVIPVSIYDVYYHKVIIHLIKYGLLAAATQLSVITASSTSQNIRHCIVNGIRALHSSNKTVAHSLAAIALHASHNM